MDPKLTIQYDAIGDILYVNKVKPYAEQDSTEVGFGIVARRHPVTGDVENLEILFFKQRSANGDVTLPISADLKLVGAATTPSASARGDGA